jgi:hypothetical protein
LVHFDTAKARLGAALPRGIGEASAHGGRSGTLPEGADEEDIIDMFVDYENFNRFSTLIQN